MNLRQQLGLAMSLLTFVIVTTLAVGASRVGEREARKATSDALTGLASTLADRLDRSMAVRMNMLEMLAKIEPLQTVWTGSPVAVRNVLDDALSVIAGASWLGFAGTDGIVVAGSGGRREGTSVSEQPWFQRGLIVPTVEGANASKLSLTGLSSDGKPYTVVDIAVPIAGRSGGPAGVLALSLNWLWAANLRQEMLNRSTEPQTKQLWILSREGRVLVGPNPGAIPYPDPMLSRMAAARSGSFRDQAKDDRILTGFATLDDHPNLGWIIVAREEEAIAFAPARRVVWVIIILGALTGALGVFGSILIADRVSRPITSLTSKADLLERDSIDTLPREGGSVEVMRLSSALRSLVLRIGSAERRTADAETRASDVARRFTDDIAMLRTLADTDALTGLFNRRSFLDLATKAMKSYREDGPHFGILMIDIDHFKSVNDKLGHSAGDSVIQWAASKINAAIRHCDKAARFGGEEFIVLVSDIALCPVAELAAHIRRAVAAEPAGGAGKDLYITVSIGGAVVDETDRDIEDLVERADLALYSAKKLGRNAVVMAPDRKTVPVRYVA
ncbi:MAG: hypothetical protein QOD94_106 [Alphaproteobacteria bacterium]|jgi:diguanylate cyclase (GGDEF)-like protein|nr:hypothetical protein [Alphaproteobacteria bacterium]